MAKKGNPNAGKNKQALSEDRTDWALYRTQLANERNFSAWVRTGLTAVGGGLAVARLLHEMGWPGLTRTVGAAFIVSGAVFLIISLVGYWRTENRLAREGVKITPFWVMSVVVFILLAAAIISLFLIFQ